MSVYKPENSKIFLYDFQYKRERFYGSTGRTNEREAEAVERDLKEKVKREIAAKAAATGTVSLRMIDVCDRYYEEVGQHHANAKNTETDLNRLVDYFGEDTLLSEIETAKKDGSEIKNTATLVAWRRKQRARPHNAPKHKAVEDYPLVSNATVNRTTTEVLKKLFSYAEDAWKVRFDNKPRWKTHMLKEPKEHNRELIGDEGQRLEAATRGDLLPFFKFVHFSGLRQEECIHLRWPNVDWKNRTIKTIGKCDIEVSVPITPEVLEILEPLRGHHSEFVFTYVAKRTIAGRVKGETYARNGKGKSGHYTAERDQVALVKGRRYPLTISGIKSAWKRLRKEAGVLDFRFHDFRHDFGTKLMRKTKSLKLVRIAMNHSDIKVTARYVHVLDEEVRAGVEDLHKTLRVAADDALQDHDTDSRIKSRNGLREVS